MFFKFNRFIIFSIIILNMFFSYLPSYASKYFSDIPEGHWAENIADLLYEENIMSGVSSNEFGGYLKLTRYDTAKILNGLLGKKYIPPGFILLSDVRGSHPDFKIIMKIINAGLMDYSNNKFDGDKKISRYDFAVSIIKLLNFLQAEPISIRIPPKKIAASSDKKDFIDKAVNYWQIAEGFYDWSENINRYEALEMVAKATKILRIDLSDKIGEIKANINIVPTPTPTPIIVKTPVINPYSTPTPTPVETLTPTPTPTTIPSPISTPTSTPVVENPNYLSNTSILRNQFTLKGFYNINYSETIPSTFSIVENVKQKSDSLGPSISGEFSYWLSGNNNILDNIGIISIISSLGSYVHPAQKPDTEIIETFKINISFLYKILKFNELELGIGPNIFYRDNGRNTTFVGNPNSYWRASKNYLGFGVKTLLGYKIIDKLFLESYISLHYASQTIKESIKFDSGQIVPSGAIDRFNIDISSNIRYDLLEFGSNKIYLNLGLDGNMLLGDGSQIIFNIGGGSGITF